MKNAVHIAILTILGLTGTLVPFSGQASESKFFPRSEPAYFSADDFSDCLANELAKEYDAHSFRARLQEIRERRHKFYLDNAEPEYCAENTKALCDLVSPIGCDFAKKHLTAVGCKATELIEKGLLYHSAPLARCEESVFDGKPSKLRLVNSWQSLSENSKTDLNALPDLRTRIESKMSSTDGMPFAPEFGKHPRKCVQKLADPLVDWLIDQPARSVTHWALVKKGKEIYGDTITALGVIGEVFDEERMMCGNRNKRCVLGNRMKLLVPTQKTDLVGQNYHFWAHVAMILREDASQEYIANYALEWLKDQDVIDYSANKVGILVSQKTVSKTKLLTGPMNRWTGFADRECRLQ